MNPGKMDRLITLEKRVLTQDAEGGRVETWGELRKVWAELVKQDGREGVVAGADRASDDIHFRIRAMRSVDLSAGEYRAGYQSKFYDIHSVTEEGRGDRLMLTCRAYQGLSHHG
jgi:SPP1 family predicted phage head-tail adaptor